MKTSDKESVGAIQKNPVRRNIIKSPQSQRSYKGTESSRGAISSGSESESNNSSQISYHHKSRQESNINGSSDSGPDSGSKRNRGEAFKQPKP